MYLNRLSQRQVDKLRLKLNENGSQLLHVEPQPQKDSQKTSNIRTKRRIWRINATGLHTNCGLSATWLRDHQPAMLTARRVIFGQQVNCRRQRSRLAAYCHTAGRPTKLITSRRLRQLRIFMQVVSLHFSWHVAWCWLKSQNNLTSVARMKAFIALLWLMGK